MNKLCASLLAIFLTGCGTKKSDFTSIEFLKYNWSRYNDTTKLEVPLFIKCRMYVIIDHTGLGKAFVYKSYPKPSTFYYSFTPDKTIIEKVLLASSKTDILKNYLKEKGPMVYDGPSLKLLIKNSKSKSILIDYIDSPPRYKYQEFVKFYYYLDSVYLKMPVNKLNDSVGFDKMRLLFIKDAVKYDSLRHHLPPPKIPDSIAVKYYVPPIINK